MTLPSLAHPAAYVPAPPFSVLHLGPLPLRMYAMCIIAGVVVAVLVGDRRWVARGGRSGTVADVAAWAVPAGLVGARIYHVATDPELYFGAGRHPVQALYIWRGGLGIWGAVAGGALAAWALARRRGIVLAALLDACAPAVALAQGIGRWGNYFNQELFGSPTRLPWALRVTHASDGNPPGLYHPTFLYESLWDLSVAALVVWADRRFRLGRGRVFALYVAAYTAGRSWIEALRVDHANRFLGLRLNDYVSIVVFAAAVAVLVVRRGPRETVVQTEPPADGADGADVPGGHRVGP